MQFLEHIKSIPEALKPFIIGFLMAYILSLPCNKMYLSLSKKIPKKPANIASVLLTELIFTGIITAFIFLIVPQCWESISKIIKQYPQYVQSLQRNYQSFVGNNDILKKSSLSRLNLLNEINKYAESTITGESETFINGVYNRITSFGTIIYNIILGFISSLFILFNREEASKNLFLLIKNLFKKRGPSIIFFIQETNSVFRQFIFGKIIDSIIVGFVIFLLFAIFKVPYALILAVFIFITNMIPIIGPIIGAIPGAILLFAEYPEKVVTFLIIVLIIQQIDGYFIGPKCIGKTIHLNTFWVLFSVIFFGKVFGIMGAFFGVPTFAVIYDILKARINNNGNSQTLMDFLLSEDDNENSKKKKRIFGLW